MTIGTDVAALKRRLAEVEQGRRNAEEVLRVASERNAELLARAEKAGREASSWRERCHIVEGERNEALERRKALSEEVRAIVGQTAVQQAVEQPGAAVRRLKAARDAEKAARERAEATLKEERAKLPAVLEQVRQTFAARKVPTPGGGLSGILAGVDELADRAERAEADNAAKSEAFRLYVEWHGVVHDSECPEDDTCDCEFIVAFNKAFGPEHPGAAMLERMRALEEVREACEPILAALEYARTPPVSSPFIGEDHRQRLANAIAKADALNGGGQ